MRALQSRTLAARKVGVAIAAAVCLSTTMGQQRVVVSSSLPVSPADPTHMDCLAMNQEFLQKVQVQYKQWEACWGRYPVRTAQCYVPKHRMQRSDKYTTVQIQCCGFEQEKARIYNEWDPQEATCKERADARKRREQDALRQSREEQEAARQLRTVRDTIGRVEAAKDAFEDPIKFLGRLPRDSELRRLVFQDSSQVKDAKLVDEVYSFLFDQQGRLGNQIIFANPVAGKIHGESLKLLRSIYDQLWIDFTSSMNDMDRLVDSVLSKPRTATPPSIRPFTAPPPGPTPAPKNNPDCAILQNIEASTRLRDSNPDRWFAIFEACERK